MESIPLWAHALALIVLLALSAFFSIAETSMIALNRYRLNHLVQQGKRGARLTRDLLQHTDKLLGTLLLGNNVINTAMTALVTALAIRYFGNDDKVLAIATSSVALLIIVFCEITPKVIGATWPERIALPASLPLRWIIAAVSPIVDLVNAIVRLLLRMVGIRADPSAVATMTNDELRALVLESSHLMPAQHRGILGNVFDLERIVVDDVMVPRNRVDALDIDAPGPVVLEQLSTAFHNKLPVCEGDINRVIGILHLRKALALVSQHPFDPQRLREVLSDPYYVPSGTPVFTQLRFFQDHRQRIALVVDEYGEVLGLVTLEDLIEEIIGEFTTNAPSSDSQRMRWSAAGDVVTDGGVHLRDLNRRLGLSLPLDGPRTLNGLILETLQGLPEGPVSLRFGDVVAEVTQVEDRAIRSVRLLRPADRRQPAGAPVVPN